MEKIHQNRDESCSDFDADGNAVLIYWTLPIPDCAKQLPRVGYGNTVAADDGFDEDTRAGLFATTASGVAGSVHRGGNTDDCI